MKGTITVIVPAYNVGSYLERCIESIRNQTYRDLQIILVDDGSTDASGDICDRFTMQDARIQVVHKANGGPSSARKAGLANARGEYVAFVDGDDYIDSNMCEELLQYLLKTDSDFVQAGYIAELGSGRSRIYLPEEEAVFDHFDECQVVSDYLLQRGEGNHGFTMESLCTKLCKRQLIAECCEKVPDDAVFGEDALAVFHCLFASKRFAIKKAAYYHYVIREDSLSCRDRDTMVFARIGDFHRHMLDAFQQYDCLEQLREQQDAYLIELLLEYLVPLGKQRGVPNTLSYCYPNPADVLGKRIAIYGAGDIGQDYYDQFSAEPSCKIVALADTYPQNCALERIKVIGLHELKALEFDMVLVAVLDQSMMLEIKESLLAIGVPERKIIWKKPGLAVQGSD